MPYTPPSAQSPASSKSSSPVTSRRSSYHHDDIPRSPISARPQPPRSHSSASYLHKHRRSPSFTKADAAPLTPTERQDSRVPATDFTTLGSLRQSPPPVNNLRIPTGAVMSPPDSSENSDGDEGTVKRGRELEQNWDQLQQAVRALPQQREGSPEKNGTHQAVQQPIPEPVPQSTSHNALSAEARKISHSRSSTETKIVIRTPTFAESPVQTSDDSDEDDGPLSKPSLVRKKSGELVKPALRPSSRRRYSSMPGTPTYSKSVHFNDSDNQTRHFLQVDKPIAVSAGTSPIETYDSESEFPFEDNSKPELEIQLTNFPADSFDRKAQPIRVERISLSADKTTLIGVCAAHNISFHKLVVARFTLDYWKTTSEVVADFNNDIRSPPTDGCDRFNFHIKLTDQANIDNKTLLLCVRYTVGGQDFWDNNNGMNYQIDFTRSKQKKVQPAKPDLNSPLGQRPLNVIPRSRHTASSSPRGRPESVDEDFISRFDASSAYSFGSPDKFLGDMNSSIKLKPKPKRPQIIATGPPSAPHNGLGSRYDFGSSLSAALSTAQDKLGRQSGFMNGSVAKQHGNSGYFGPLDRTEPTKADARTERPDAITSTETRPAMGSDQYRDLVQKFCYFTSGTGIKGASSPPPGTPKSTAQPQPKPAPGTDSITETYSTATSSRSSGTVSPVHQIDGASDRAIQSPILSPFSSRPSSPAPITGQSLSARSASPVSFGYPYHSHRDGYLSDAPTPTAIHG